MKRGSLIFVIDALMFLGMTALVGLGLLMKYVLVPGRETWVKYGGRVDLTWLGFDRHDWGAVHLYLAFCFLGLLAAHIVLHWQMIVALYEKWLPQVWARRLVAPAFGLLALLLVYFPALVTPEVREFPAGRGRFGEGVEGLPPAGLADQNSRPGAAGSVKPVATEKGGIPARLAASVPRQKVTKTSVRPAKPLQRWRSQGQKSRLAARGPRMRQFGQTYCLASRRVFQ